MATINNVEPLAISQLVATIVANSAFQSELQTALSGMVSGLVARGGTHYLGTWDATQNSPVITSSVAPPDGLPGGYYVASVAGSTTIDGVSTWNVGDWIVWDGHHWDKVDGQANPVTSVAGLQGSINANTLKVALAIAAGDVAGLGTAARANIGTATGNVADGGVVATLSSTVGSLSGASSSQGSLLAQQGTTLTTLGSTVASQGQTLTQLGNTVGGQTSQLSSLTQTVTSQGTVVATALQPTDIGTRVAPLTNGKVPFSALPASLAGALHYLGAWDPVLNAPTLVSGSASPDTLIGSYYVASRSGTQPIDGVTTWTAGDWIVWDGSHWDKLDGAANPVSSVVGLQGGISGPALSAALGLQAPATAPFGSTINTVADGGALAAAAGVASNAQTIALAAVPTALLNSTALVSTPANMPAGRYNISTWVSASRDGLSRPLAWFQNQPASVLALPSDAPVTDTTNRYLSAAHASAAVPAPTSPIIDPQGVFQAAWTYSQFYNVTIDCPEDRLPQTSTPIYHYSKSPPYRARIRCKTYGGFTLESSFNHNLSILGSTSAIAQIQNLTIDEGPLPLGFVTENIRLTSKWSYAVHWYTGRLTTTVTDQFAVNIGDWGTNTNPPVEIVLDPLNLPQAGDTTLHLTYLLPGCGVGTYAAGTGPAIISPRHVVWGTTIASITANAVKGGYDYALNTWSTPQNGATYPIAVSTYVPWFSSAFQTSPVGNIIYVDALPYRLPVSFVEGAPLDIPLLPDGSSYVVPGSIVRTILPNSNYQTWQPNTSYPAGTFLANYNGVYGTQVGGMSGNGTGPYGKTPVLDGNITWVYQGPLGYLVTLSPPTGYANAVLTSIPPNTPLIQPSRFILATGVFPNVSTPGPNHPIQYQGSFVQIRAAQTEMINCILEGNTGANGTVTQGSMYRRGCRQFVSSGTNGRVFSQASGSGGILCSGGSLIIDDERGNSGDDYFACGTQRQANGNTGVLKPFSNLPIYEYIVRNSEVTSFQAHGVSVFTTISGAQKATLLALDPSNPPARASNTLQITALPSGFTLTNIVGQYIFQKNLLAVGTTILSATLVGSGPAVLLTLQPAVGVTYAVLKNGGTVARIASAQPPPTLSASVERSGVYDSILRSMGSNGLGLLANNTTGDTYFDIMRTKLDMSWNTFTGSTGISITGSQGNIHPRIHDVHVISPFGPAMDMSGTFPDASIRDCIFEACQQTFAGQSWNVRIWGVSRGLLQHNDFGGVLSGSGDDLSLGGPPSNDIYGNVLSNACSDLTLRDNSYLGIADGRAGLVMAYCTGVTIEGWERFYGASPLGVAAGAKGFSVDLSSCNAIYYNKMDFTGIDGAAQVLLAGSGTYTTGYDFLLNPGASPPAIALSSQFPSSGLSVDGRSGIFLNGSVLSAAIFAPYLAGNFYDCEPLASQASSVKTTITATAGMLYALPMTIRSRVVVTGIGVRVLTASSGGGQVRLGISTFTGPGGPAANLLLDAGVGSTDAAVGLKLSVSNGPTLTAGTYLVWAEFPAIGTGSPATLTGAPIAALLESIFGASNIATALQNSGIAGLVAAGTSNTGTLPATLPAVSYLTTAAAPAITLALNPV